MSHDDVMLYVELRKLGKIGVLFGGESEGWKLAPIGVCRPWQHAEGIGEVSLVKLLKLLKEDKVELHRLDVDRESLKRERKVG